MGRAILSLMLSLLLAAPVLAQSGNGPLPALVPPMEARDQALDCLTSAIAHEAATEPLAGRQAVAQVVMNRLRAPAYPKTICGVIFQGAERRTGCQFSFTCDGALSRFIPSAILASARQIATSALDDALPDRIGNATHYHAYYVSPTWAPRLQQVGRIGAHIFYRSPATALAVPRSRPLPDAEISASSAQSETVTVFSAWGLPLAHHQ